MTWRDAIDHLAAAGHPHAWRFRELCQDDTDPERRDGYRAVVIRLASGEPLGPPTRVDYSEPPVGAPLPCCGQSILEDPWARQ